MTDRRRDLVPTRAVSALAVTVLGLALLFSFRTPDAAALLAPADGGSAVVGQPPATADGSLGKPVPATTPAPATTPVPSGAAATTYVDGTVTGPVISMRYGDVQVQVTIAGGVVTDVQALELPSSDGRSVRISQIAGPLLRDEALAAQDAEIDVLSGATYTSTAYARSLQAALDRARA